MKFSCSSARHTSCRFSSPCACPAQPRTSRVSLLHSQLRLSRGVRGPLCGDPVRCQGGSPLRLRGSCSPLPLCPRRWGLQRSPLALTSRVHCRRCLLLGGREERPPPLLPDRLTLPGLYESRGVIERPACFRRGSPLCLWRGDACEKCWASSGWRSRSPALRLRFLSAEAAVGGSFRRPCGGR